MLWVKWSYHVAQADAIAYIPLWPMHLKRLCITVFFNWGSDQRWLKSHWSQWFQMLLNTNQNTNIPCRDNNQTKVGDWRQRKQLIFTWCHIAERPLFNFHHDYETIFTKINSNIGMTAVPISAHCKYIEKLMQTIHQENALPMIVTRENHCQWLKQNFLVRFKNFLFDYDIWRLYQTATSI